jgi:rhamnogalacturonan endolyase
MDRSGEPIDLAFDLYRSDGKSEINLNDQSLFHGTNFIDRAPPRDVDLTCRVQPVGTKAPNNADRQFTLPAGRNVPYLEIPIQDLPEGYLPNDATVADLDGNGQLDVSAHLVNRSRTRYRRLSSRSSPHQPNRR